MSWFKTEFPDEKILAYVDTGPIMEKVIAQQAGLGWQGKHSNLITKDLGSWVFLAEFITTLELEPDAPETDFCGTCTACIDACPTQAIVEPYVVDANKCISYLTIELPLSPNPSPSGEGRRGEGQCNERSNDERGTWIYGCDICQDVCPWNRFQKDCATPEFQARPSYQTLTPEKIAAMDEAKFQEIFKGSAIRRTKLAGLQRNVSKT